MDSAWIGVVGALGGVCVGSLAEAFRGHFMFRREKAWSLYEERRDRIEQVYEALEQVREAYGQAYPIALHAAWGTDAPNREAMREKVPWSRLRMLVHLYLPELRDELEAIERQGGQLGKALGQAVMNGSSDRANAENLVERIEATFREFDVALNRARDKTVREATRLATETSRRTDRTLVSGGWYVLMNLRLGRFDHCAANVDELRASAAVTLLAATSGQRHFGFRTFSRVTDS